jgi:hypothetical protein
MNKNDRDDGTNRDENENKLPFNENEAIEKGANGHVSLNEKIESIFKEIGEFGRYQLLIFILVGIISFVPAIVGYSFGFYAASPSHRYY